MKTGRTIAVFAAFAALAVAAPATAAPPKVVPTDSFITAVPNPLPASAPSVTVSGKLTAKDDCEEGRVLNFTYGPSQVTTFSGLATSGADGTFTVALPRPTKPGRADVLIGLNFASDDRTVTKKVKKKGKRGKKKRVKVKERITCREGGGTTILQRLP